MVYADCAGEIILGQKSKNQCYMLEKDKVFVKEQRRRQK